MLFREISVVVTDRFGSDTVESPPPPSSSFLFFVFYSATTNFLCVILYCNGTREQVDFDDRSSWEYLFKDYYIDLKEKLLEFVMHMRNGDKSIFVSV